MTTSKGYAAQNSNSPLAPYQFERREPGEHDVLIDIHYCGVCHSDIHQVRNEWGNSLYPMVPGHEIVGKVKQVGSKVKRFKPGDLAGVGCMVDSCRKCTNCQKHLEQFCEEGPTLTYNSRERGSKDLTYGGYSDNIVVHEDFVLSISPNLSLPHVAPLLCAGITTYSPLKRWKVGKNHRVGIVGLGGLGHMAVKLAHSMGAHVTVFTTSPSKIDDAKRLGAHEVILSKDKSQMSKHAKEFDFILNTVCAPIDLGAYLALLKTEATMVQVGVPSTALPLNIADLVLYCRQLGGSLIGGIKETQEMLDYCAKHEITSDIELITMDKINEAYERTIKGDVKYRFVIDLRS